MWFPSEEQRQEALFEHAYIDYVVALTSCSGRVPASREVILEEARHTTITVFDLLVRKRVRLEP